MQVRVSKNAASLSKESAIVVSEILAVLEDENRTGFTLNYCGGDNRSNPALYVTGGNTE